MENNKIQEASYAGNIGIMELIKFYREGTPDEVKKVKQHIASNRNKQAWDIVQRVSKTRLHPSAVA